MRGRWWRVNAVVYPCVWEYCTHIEPGHFACTICQQMKLHRKTPSAHDVRTSRSSASAASDQASARARPLLSAEHRCHGLLNSVYGNPPTPFNQDAAHFSIVANPKCCARYGASHLTRSTSPHHKLPSRTRSICAVPSWLVVRQAVHDVWSSDPAIGPRAGHHSRPGWVCLASQSQPRSHPSHCQSVRPTKLSIHLPQSHAEASPAIRAHRIRRQPFVPLPSRTFRCVPAPSIGFRPPSDTRGCRLVQVPKDSRQHSRRSARISFSLGQTNGAT